MNLSGKRLFWLLLTACSALTACSRPSAPVHILSVERLPHERVIGSGRTAYTEVVYRVGVKAADLPRLKGPDGRLEFYIFRCNRPGREWAMETAIEPPPTGAEIAYIRILTTTRHVDTDNWHCGSFQQEQPGLIFGSSEDLSEVFRFQPEGDTDLTRDQAPNSVRTPPPPPLKGS